ncbi:MAG TPA: hypothetical protein VGR45_10385 [Stellaceae bacterium]|nr:hypothetical protein [Stellaceae bacterium]
MNGRIERVVVQLDASSDNRVAIDTAARLAARAKASLHGVFVEDQDLLHWAGLPFARQITVGASAEPFTTEQIELHLQVEAGRAQRDFHAAAKRHGLDDSFEVVRGALETALSVATERDLVVAGGLTRPIAGHFRVACRWWSLIASAPAPFLLARDTWDSAGAVVTLLGDRGPAAIRLIEASAKAAEARDGVLTVICLPGIAGTQGFEKWIEERLSTYRLRVQIEVAPDEFIALAHRIGELDCRLLAIDANLSEDSADRLREFVERCACDIRFVR